MEYTQITCDSDIVTFLGTVVLMKSSSYYYTKNRKEVFACVDATPSKWSGGEIGPNINTLYLPDEVPSNCVLIKSKYTETPVYLRLATADDIVFLRTQVDEGKLQFEYHKGIPTHYPLHPNYDRNHERGIDAYNDGVTVKLRPWTMDVVYEYSGSFLEEIDSAKNEKRLPTGKVFMYFFKKYAGDNIDSYTMEKTINKIESKWGGYKFDDKFPTIGDETALVVPGASSSLMAAIALNQPRNNDVVLNVLTKMIADFCS